MFQLSAMAASMKRLIRNCTRNGDTTAGATASAKQTAAAPATSTRRLLSTEASRPENASRPKNQDQDEKSEAQEIGIRRSHVGSGERFDDAEHEAAHQGPHHRA